MNNNGELVLNVELVGMSHTEKVNALVATGAKKISTSLQRITALEDAEKVSLTFASPIAVLNHGVEETPKSMPIYRSALTAAIAEDELLSTMAPILDGNPVLAKVILANAKVTLLQQDVPAGTSYISAFATKTDVAVHSYEWDTRPTYLIGIELSARAEKMCEKILDQMAQNVQF